MQTLSHVAEFWAVASQIASERGGLVVGVTGQEQPEVGSKLDSVLGFQAPMPVTVTGVAEWDDWKQQAEAFYRLRPSWGRGHPGDPTARYYRVTFPDQGARYESWPVRSASALDFSRDTSNPALPSFAGYAEVSSGRQGARFAIRAAARIVDFLLHYAIAFLMGWLFRFMILVSSGGHPPMWVFLHLARGKGFILLGSLLGIICYEVISTTICGSSLGKRMCSLQVLQDDGSPCRLRSAVIRELGYFVDSLFFGLIGYAAMRSTDEQKRYGDEWAGTIVCRLEDVPAQSLQSGSRFALGLSMGVAADMAWILMGLLLQLLI